MFFIVKPVSTCLVLQVFYCSGPSLHCFIDIYPWWFYCHLLWFLLELKYSTLLYYFNLYPVCRVLFKAFHFHQYADYLLKSLPYCLDLNSLPLLYFVHLLDFPLDLFPACSIIAYVLACRDATFSPVSVLSRNIFFTSSFSLTDIIIKNCWCPISISL